MTDVIRALRKNRTLAITLVIFLLLFLLAIQGMSAKDWTITVLRGLSVGAVTFLVAAGFSIILGLMDVLNLAHGTLYMIGAYVGWSVYVRPDTVIDLITPLALLAAGLTLLPLWKGLLTRVGLPGPLAQVWPWLGSLIALLLLAVSLPRVPLAIWDAEVYDASPVVWTQQFQNGILAQQLEPARLEGGSPLLVWGGVVVGSILAAASLAGFVLRRQRAETISPAKRFWVRPLAGFVTLLVLGLGVYLANDVLTDFLLGLNTTWLFVIAVVVATLVGAGLGALMEVALIRPLYERAIYQIMLTFGLAFIGTEVVRAIWGRSGFTMPKPALFAGRGDGCPATSLADWLAYHCSTLKVEIGGQVARIRVYNEIFLIVLGVVVLVVVWLLLQRTRLGMIIRAGVQDREMVEALGINVRRVFTLVFALGVALAALGGVLAAPAMGLSDGMGANLLLGALIALAIGGLTSYPGAAVGSVIVGLLQQFIIKYGQIGIKLPFLEEPFKPTPPLVPASTVLLMVVILLVMPQGLFGRQE